MARQVLPIVGAVVGAYFGNPQLGYAVGSIIGNAVDPQVIQGPKIGEAGIQTAAEGGPMAIVMGTAPVVGNIICRGNKQIKKKKESAGKGGPVTESERVYWTFAIAIGEPIDAITRIWMDEKLVYDIRPESTIVAESAEFAQKFTFYDGSETQEADPDLEAFIGMGEVPTYRGTAYVVFPNFDLTDTGQRIPTFRFECASNADISDLTASVIIGISNSPTLETAVSQSADGTQWGELILEVPLAAYIASTQARHITWDLSSAYYSDDNGATWIGPIGSFGGIGGQHQCHMIGETLLIPGGLNNGVFRSTDVSQGFDHIEGFSSNNIAIRNGFGISLYGDECFVTFSDGLSWAEGQAPDIYASQDRWLACNETCFLLGGRTDVGGIPAVTRTTNGNSWSATSFNGSAAGGVSYLCPGKSGQWVALCDNGEIWYSVNDGSSFVEANDSLGIIPSGLSYNGNLFIAAGGPETGGIVKTSTNLSDWTTRDQPLDEIGLVSSLQNPAGQAEGQPVTLASIVTKLHGRVQQPTTKFNVTALTDEVDGVVFAGDYTVADAIRSVIAPYFSDASEYDGGSGWKINYIKRGAAVVKTLTEDDLVDEPENSVRESAIEYPKALDMFFQSPTVGYAPAKASPQRSSPDIRVVGRVQAQVPVTFADEDDAWKIADKMLKVAWADAEGEVKFTVSDEHLDLVPSDCIGLSLRGTVRRLRITKIEDNPGTRTLTCRVDRQSAYTSNLTGIPLPPPTPPPPSIVGQAIGVILDIPALTDFDDVLGYYDGMAGQTDAWHGGDMQRQNGVGDFDTVNSFGSGTVIGVLLDAVTDASEHYTDTTNVLHVQFYTDQEIDSLTNAQFLSEGGALAVEWTDSNGTRWEIMQYRDAEEVEADEYKLTTLHRGRLNSGTAAHAAGDKVVFLEGVKRVSAVTAMLDTDLTHRAVSYDTSPENALEVTDAYTGLMQTEWPVAQLTGDIDGNDLDLSCVPRHRFGTDDNPVQSINHDGYRWTATDGTNSLSADTTGTTHTFDVTGWSTPITATVAQLNRYTGAGQTVSEDFE